MIISDAASHALYGATIKRGKDKGLLLKTAPKDQLAKAAWYGAQMVCNPYKVSISAIIFFTEKQTAIYQEIITIFDELTKTTKGAIVSLDKDRATLERLRVW